MNGALRSMWTSIWTEESKRIIYRRRATLQKTDLKQKNVILLKLKSYRKKRKIKK